MGVSTSRHTNNLYTLYRQPRPKRSVLVAAWPGIGNVGLIVARYLRDSLGAEEIGEIKPSSFFEPVGVMVRQNVIEEPRFPESKFYYWRNPRSGEGLLIFIGEEQPSSKGYEMVRCVLDVASRFRVARVYSCAAAITQRRYGERSKVWGVATRGELLEQLSSHDLVLKGDLRIAGLNGLILGSAKERGLDGVSLLGEVPGYATQLPNPEAALAVTKVLTDMLVVDVDLTQLSDSARQSEEQLERMAKQVTAAYIDRFTEPIWEQGATGGNGNGHGDEDEDDEEDDE